MRETDTNSEDRAAIALQALAWTLADDSRAQRLLALTGLTGDELRRRLTDPGLHEALFAFLQGHQPDLLACAEALGVAPQALLPKEDNAF
jgi:Protein of unknown function (DUF3572)